MGSKVPFEEQVRVRAYEIFIERAEKGGAEGSPEQDWLQAEAEVRSRQQPEASDGKAARAASGRDGAASAASATQTAAAAPRKSVKTTKPTTANRRSH